MLARAPHGPRDDPSPARGFLPTSWQAARILAPAGSQIALTALATALGSASGEWRGNCKLRGMRRSKNAVLGIFASGPILKSTGAHVLTAWSVYKKRSPQSVDEDSRSGVGNCQSSRVVILTTIRRIRFHLLLCVSLCVCSFQSAAQTVLDPSLPPGSQPLVKRQLLHLFPDFESVQPGAHVAPLSVRQKFRLFAGETFDPSLVVIAAAVAGLQQAGNLAPKYGQGADP
jgi:hypothetical protein